MKIASFRTLVSLSGFLWFILAIYSFSQVDLNLTLFTHTTYLNFQQTMTYLGYFQRPISAIIFSVTVILLTVIYIEICRKTLYQTYPMRKLFSIMLILYGIVFFAYPAFSYDIYNYMFDARIVTSYRLSPYYFRALDFPDDSWTRFMRWTHRYYPYGPLWLYLTLVPSYLGRGTFLSTLFFFKLLFFLGAVINASLIYSIASALRPKIQLASFTFFAFNPLIIIESVLSPHNEVFLLLFALLSVFLVIKKRWIFSLVFLILSIAIKFLTAIFIPLLVWKWLRKDAFADTKLLGLCMIFFALTLVPLIYFREMYPWYFIPLLALASFFVNRPLIFWLGIGLTLGLLLRYVPYLWLGDWSGPVALLNNVITTTGICLGLLLGIVQVSKSTKFQNIGINFFQNKP